MQQRERIESASASPNSSPSARNSSTLSAAGSVLIIGSRRQTEDQDEYERPMARARRDKGTRASSTSSIHALASGTRLRIHQ